MPCSFQPLVPRIVAREACLAAYHAAEGLVSERTGKYARTHRCLRAQFARVAKDEPGIDQTLSEFSGRACELKSLSDYGTGVEAVISVTTANAAVATATRFVECVALLLAPAASV
jgi:uncharacterized protein (UPF0332 family)